MGYVGFMKNKEHASMLSHCHSGSDDVHNSLDPEF